VDKFIGRGDIMWITILSVHPPLAWGYTPLYGGPSPRIPPYYRSKCQFGGDNTMSNAKKIFGKKLSFFWYLLNMDYIITENRLLRLIDNYIEETFGELKKIPYKHINAREGDFELVSEDKTIFLFMDHSLEVDKNLFNDLKGLFNLSGSEMAQLFEIWFQKHFPDDLLLQVYASID